MQMQIQMQARSLSDNAIVLEWLALHNVKINTYPDNKYPLIDGSDIAPNAKAFMRPFWSSYYLNMSYVSSEKNQTISLAIPADVVFLNSHVSANQKDFQDFVLNWTIFMISPNQKNLILSPILWKFS